jgi:hypothetical protein
MNSMGRSLSGKSQPIKNKGSTESLPPRIGHENPFPSNENDNLDYMQLNPFSTPKTNYNGFAQCPNPPAMFRNTPSPNETTPTPRSPPNVRQSLQTTSLTQPRISYAVLKKRMTESRASGKSHASKNRTRSMIIVRCWWNKACTVSCTQRFGHECQWQR